MPSFRTRISPRRGAYLSLSSQVEGQLREAYARKFEAGLATQAGIAEKLGVDRSAVHRRLTGRTNMTLETLADMAWALDQVVEVTIRDAREQPASPIAARPQDRHADRGAAKAILARAGKRRPPRPNDRLDAD